MNLLRLNSVLKKLKMDADERRKMLYAEFQLVDTDHDGVFTKQDLFRYLDRRNVGVLAQKGRIGL